MDKILKLTSKIIKPHGFVKLVDVSPRFIPAKYNDLNCDYAIVEAARVSYSEGTKRKSTDSSLINYLYKNNHTSPFEMVQFKFHIKAPLFIVRQWQRHRMSSYNEISGRYSILQDSFWEPDFFRKQSIVNKQGSEEKFDNIRNNTLLQHYRMSIKDSYSTYTSLINAGVSREMARTVLPVGIYTEFYWKIDLHNLLRFISLRSDKHAQEEIREYSDTIKDIITEYCPVTMEAFKEYSVDSIKLSKKEIESIKLNNNGNNISSKSGKIEFNNKLKLLNLIKE